MYYFKYILCRTRDNKIYIRTTWNIHSRKFLQSSISIPFSASSKEDTPNWNWRILSGCSAGAVDSSELCRSLWFWSCWVCILPEKVTSWRQSEPLCETFLYISAKSVRQGHHKFFRQSITSPRFSCLVCQFHPALPGYTQACRTMSPWFQNVLPYRPQSAQIPWPFLSRYQPSPLTYLQCTALFIRTSGQYFPKDHSNGTSEKTQDDSSELTGLPHLHQKDIWLSYVHDTT